MMTDADPAAQCAMAIMAKESRPGLCKTRLTPPLTPEEAACMNTAFLRDISANIAAAARSAPIQGYAAYWPLGAEPFFDNILAPGFKLYHPPEPGIGRALFRTAEALLDVGHRSVCMVNSDSPNLPPAFLVRAVHALHAPGERIVLGPSEDGGYYLIGLTRFRARLFEDIDWSTERVTGQTLQRAAELGLEVVMLPPWYDVDDAAMLARLARDVRNPPPEASPAAQAAAYLDALRAAGRLSD